MKKRQSVSKIAKAAVQEVKDNAKDIMNTPIVEKAKETVKDVAEKAEDTVKTVTKAAKDAGNRIEAVTLEVSGLDIDMDERSGMDIARRVRELHLDTILIFVTNYPEFSIEGYEVRAFRYLLKQEMQQKLPLYFRDALAEIPHGKKELRFSVNAEPYRVAY